MATLTLQSPGLTGNAVNFAAADVAGDKFPASATVQFFVKNASGSSKTVTFNSIKPCDQGFDHDLVVTVPANDERLVGPFDSRFWASDNTIGVSYSAVTSMTVAALA